MGQINCTENLFACSNSNYYAVERKLHLRDVALAKQQTKTVTLNRKSCYARDRITGNVTVKRDKQQLQNELAKIKAFHSL